MYTGDVKPAPVQAFSDLFRDIPAGVSAVLAQLAEAGHAAFLVGGCVRDRLRAEAVADYDITTAAGPKEILALFPRAIPIGLRHGTVMQPTPDGAVDVTSFRCGNDIETDLAHRDFTINAMAYDPRHKTLVDPFGGQRDLADRRLRAVGRPEDRFREDPVRALRAARLVASLDLEPDPELSVAMAGARFELQRTARERLRHEIEQLMRAPRAHRGLALLRDTGIEADLAPGTRSDAIEVVGALPPELTLRLAGWLRETHAERILSKLRFPRRTTASVAHLLRHHPIGSNLNPKRDVAVRKLIKRVHEEDIVALCALRRAELTVRGDDAIADVEALSRIEAAIQRVVQAGALALHRFDLAIDGSDVMDVLGCGPGRRVGQALRYLTDRVIEDPDVNTPGNLRALLKAWEAARPDR